MAMIAFKTEQPEIIRKAFPRTWYYPRWRIVTWFPQGVLNEAFVDQVLNFIEMEEHIQEAPFDRYADLSGLTSIRLDLPHIFRAARRRRRVTSTGEVRPLCERPGQFWNRADLCATNGSSDDRRERVPGPRGHRRVARSARANPSSTGIADARSGERKLPAAFLL